VTPSLTENTKILWTSLTDIHSQWSK